MKKILIFILLLSVLSCNKKKFLTGPNTYTDGFEQYNSIEDLIDSNNKNWSFFQNTYEGNYEAVDSNFSHSGNKSIKFSAAQANNDKGASKASMNKQKMAFWERDIISISAWYYIVGTDKADWLFIFDIEEQTLIGAGPGMRLAIVDNRILVEHKYLKPNIYQTEGKEIDFPRNQWVNIRYEAKLFRKNKGYVKVWQDGTLIIEQYEWQTLPTDILYGLQGTKGMYSSIEFGITANTSDNPMVMYVDDIDVK